MKMGFLRRSDSLLVLGMLVGAGLAACGLGQDETVRARAGLSPDVVAVVAGEPISKATLETAVALVERDRQTPVTAEEKSRILQRLIDEELLFQRGLALGLVRSDRKLRAELVASVVDAATSEAAMVEPTPEELRAFFDQHKAMFATTPAVGVAQVFVATATRREAEAASRAASAAARLRGGEDVAAVRRALGDPPSVEIPASLLPASRLRDYVGTAAAEVALALRVGDVSDPQSCPDGYRVIVMLERGEVATFEDHQEDVRAEMRRRANEVALRAYLDQLRGQSKVEVASSEDKASR
jgi:parvulin-like peptidyl-prolyl isomerase